MKIGCVKCKEDLEKIWLIVKFCFGGRKKETGWQKIQSSLGYIYILGTLFYPT